MARRRDARFFVGCLAALLAAAAGCLIPPQSREDERLVVRSRPRPNPARPDKLPALPSLYTAVLPSGLRVVIDRDVYATAAGVVSVVAGGAGADPVGHEGLAHLVEHLTYSSVRTQPETALPLEGAAPPANHGRPTLREKLVRYAAVVSNGLTSPDAMTFYEFGPVTRLRWLVEMEAGRLAEPLAGITEEDVAFERGVIAQEHQLRGDTRSGASAMNQLFPTLFPAEHPYARPTGGTPASRERLTLADARGYVAQVFRPERMTVLVSVGSTGADMDTIISWLPKALTGDHAHPVTRPAPPPSPAVAPIVPGPVTRLPSSLPTAQLWIAWTLPGGFGPALPTEEMLARWVEDDLRVADLRQEEPRIRQTAAVLLPGAKGTALAVRVLLDDGADPDRVMQVVATRVGSLWTREAAEKELMALIRGRLASETVLDDQVPVGRAVEEAEAAALGPAPRAHSQIVEDMVGMKATDLAKFAYENLGAPRARGVLFSPTEAAVEPARRASAHNHRVAETRAGGLMAQAAAWDPMELPGSMLPPAPASSRLANGTTVIVDRRSNRAVTAWLAFHGGYSDATPPLVVELALRARADAFDAPKHLALAGRDATVDASIETLSFRPPDLVPALDLLFAKATAPIRNWPTPDALKRIVEAAHASVDPTSEKANQAFVRRLFANHPLGRVVDPADLANITRSEVDSWIGRVYNLRNAVLIVVGDVEPNDVYAAAGHLATKYSAPAWVGDIPAPPAPTLRPAGGDHVGLVVTPRRGALAEVRLACLLPPMTALDRTDYGVLRWAMKERLSTALRYERGDTYDLDVGYDWTRGGATVLQVATFLDSGDLADGLDVLHANWRRWGQHGFEPGELNAGRWETTGARLLTLASNAGIAYHLFKDWSSDPQSVGKNTFGGEALSTRPERLAELFATCRANAVLGLTGNETAIRDAVKRAWPEAK